MDKWDSYRTSAEKAMQMGRLDNAESYMYAALTEAEDFERDDPRLLWTIERLAEILFRQQKYDQAEPMCRRAIETYEIHFGSDHPDVGILTNNLAMLCHLQKKMDDAELLYKKALDMQTKTLGVNHPEVRNLLGNYANLLQSTHREAEAEHMRKMAKGIVTGRWNTSGTYKAFARENQIGTGQLQQELQAQGAPKKDPDAPPALPPRR
jgi:tetratricopeptide (TPR) repeat protein